MTGITQTAAAISLMNCDTIGTDLVEVSAHAGARPSHAEWQGKIYCIRGSRGRYRDFYKETGYGTGDGLCGWNCRHSFGPGDPADNPYKGYDAEENKKAYDLSQKPRAAERKIRNQKYKVLALSEAVKNAPDEETANSLKDEYSKEALKLQKYNGAYKAFCEENNLQTLQDRIFIAKWNRSEAAKAKQATKQYIINKSQDKLIVKDVTDEYNKNAIPNKGSIIYSEGYKLKNHNNEIRIAEWLFKKFGGKITLIAEPKESNIVTPDFFWNSKMWELKNVTTQNSIDKNLQKALKQISENPGGVILDRSNSNVEISDMLELIKARIARSKIANVDIMIKTDQDVVKILRYKKEKRR